MSYLYTKKFLETELKRLNKPIEINEELKTIAEDEGINLKQLQIVIMRLNLLVKRHNHNVFSPRIINQVVQQILKSERYKVELVNERLTKVQALIKPLLIPSKDCASSIEQLDVLVNQLPEGKYLFVTKNSQIRGHQGLADLEGDLEGDLAGLDHNLDGLVQDDQELVSSELPQDQYERNIFRAVDKASAGEEEMLQQYETLRLALVKKNTTLQYKHKKLVYLKQLRQKLSTSLGVTLEEEVRVENTIPQELNNFRILVDQIKFRNGRIRIEDEVWTHIEDEV